MKQIQHTLRNLSPKPPMPWWPTSRPASLRQKYLKLRVVRGGRRPVCSRGAMKELMELSGKTSGYRNK
eukprot:47080-Amorphochlora_amoeboformis.AAC.1